MTEKKKRFTWVLLIALAALALYLLLPERLHVKDTFTGYALEDESLMGSFPMEITLTSSRLPFTAATPDVELTIHDRSYRFVQSDAPDRKEKYIPLSGGPFKFGVLLPSDRKGEFIVLFDADHHYGENTITYAAAYPARDRTETMALLARVLEQNQYDITQKPVH